MDKLRLPVFDFKIDNSENPPTIWDEFRKKYVVLTPEEWVRQHFLKYMQLSLGYPKTLLKVETGITYNKLKKRPDIIAYDNTGNPLAIVECKASYVKITEEVFKQVTVYNKILKAQYIMVTNGMDHFCCEQDFNSGTFRFLDKIPEYKL